MIPWMPDQEGSAHVLGNARHYDARPDPFGLQVALKEECFIRYLSVCFGISVIHLPVYKISPESSP